LLLLAILTTAVLTAAFIDFAVGHHQLRSLKDVTPTGTGPPVSIVAAARNEARHIEAAVMSLLRLE
jgi:hypothetical protein